MLGKDKLWLAYYINISGLNDEYVQQYVYDLVQFLDEKDETVKQLFIPTREGDSRVECIYDPTGNSAEKYEEFFKKAEEYINNFNKQNLEYGTTTEESAD